jgi:hypothetical protein
MAIELIDALDLLNTGRIKINHAYSAQTNIWTSSTGSYSIIANNYTGNQAVGYKSVAIGKANTASGNYASVLGGYNNIASGTKSIIVGGEQNTAISTSGFIGNGYANRSGSLYAIVVGGANNSATTSFSAIVGGRFNMASGSRAFVGGGQANSGTSSYSTIIGGFGNICNGSNSFIGGGRSNQATPTSGFATIGGGYQNSATTTYAFIGGGKQNLVSGSFGVVLGGQNNSALTSYSSIVSGKKNMALHKNFSFIGSGSGNTVRNATYGFVGNGKNNKVRYQGGYSTAGEAAKYGCIINGLGNQILGNDPSYGGSKFIFIGTGVYNKAYSYYSTIINGKRNKLSGRGSAIVNGFGCQLTNTYAFIGTGLSGKSTTDGAIVRSVGAFSMLGDAQVEQLVARRQTTDATTQNLLVRINSSIVLNNNSAVSVIVRLNAVQVAGVAGTVGDSWFHELRALVKRISAVTSLVGAVDDTTIAEDAGAVTWTGDISPTGTIIRIRVTGETNKTINWVASVELVEAAYA